MIGLVTRKNEVTIISLSGSLDVSVQSKFKEELVNASRHKDDEIILDFEKVSFIDSSCLGVLVSLTKRIREEKGDIKLSQLSSDVRSIFQITRLDNVFEIYDSNDDAVDSFFRKA